MELDLYQTCQSVPINPHAINPARRSRAKLTTPVWPVDNFGWSRTRRRSSRGHPCFSKNSLAGICRCRATSTCSPGSGRTHSRNRDLAVRIATGSRGHDAAASHELRCWRRAPRRRRIPTSPPPREGREEALVLGLGWSSLLGVDHQRRKRWDGWGRPRLLAPPLPQWCCATGPRGRRRRRRSRCQRGSATGGCQAQQPHVCSDRPPRPLLDLLCFTRPRRVHTTEERDQLKWPR
jgi:hypothetical protein